jgi:hypothetical protein
MAESDRENIFFSDINGIYLVPSDRTQHATVDPTVRVPCATHGSAVLAVLINERYECASCNPNATRQESYMERKMREHRAN